MSALITTICPNRTQNSTPLLTRFKGNSSGVNQGIRLLLMLAV